MKPVLFDVDPKAILRCLPHVRRDRYYRSVQGGIHIRADGVMEATDGKTAVFVKSSLGTPPAGVDIVFDPGEQTAALRAACKRWAKRPWEAHASYDPEANRLTLAGSGDDVILSLRVLDTSPDDVGPYPYVASVVPPAALDATDDRKNAVDRLGMDPMLLARFAEGEGVKSVHLTLTMHGDRTAMYVRVPEAPEVFGLMMPCGTPDRDRAQDGVPAFVTPAPEEQENPEAPAEPAPTTTEG